MELALTGLSLSGDGVGGGGNEAKAKFLSSLSPP